MCASRTRTCRACLRRLNCECRRPWDSPTPFSPVSPSWKGSASFSSKAPLQSRSEHGRPVHPATLTSCVSPAVWSAWGWLWKRAAGGHASKKAARTDWSTRLSTSSSTPSTTSTTRGRAISTSITTFQDSSLQRLSCSRRSGRGVRVSRSQACPRPARTGSDKRRSSVYTHFVIPEWRTAMLTLISSPGPSASLSLPCCRNSQPSLPKLDASTPSAPCSSALVQQYPTARGRTAKCCGDGGSELRVQVASPRIGSLNWGIRHGLENQSFCGALSSFLEKNSLAVMLVSSRLRTHCSDCRRAAGGVRQGMCGDRSGLHAKGGAESRETSWGRASLATIAGSCLRR